MSTALFLADQELSFGCARCEGPTARPIPNSYGGSGGHTYMGFQGEMRCPVLAAMRLDSITCPSPGAPDVFRSGMGGLEGVAAEEMQREQP